MSYENALKTVDFLLEVLAEADKPAKPEQKTTPAEDSKEDYYTSVEDDGIEEGKTVKVTTNAKVLDAAWIEAELGENDDKGMYLGAIGQIVEIEEDDDTVKLRYANYDTMWMPIKACVSSNGAAETLPKGMISHLDDTTLEVEVVAKQQLPSSWTTTRKGRFTLHRAPQKAQSNAFEEAVARGLSSASKFLDSQYAWNAIGSEHYERITEQPDYYPARCEDRILAEHAEDIRRRVGDVTLIELGSGSSTKTRHLLDAGFQRYAAIDISGDALEAAGEALMTRYLDELTVEAFATTYEDGLTRVAHLQPAMLCCLGGSLGNLTPQEANAFLEQVAASLQPGGFFLLGIDLVKDTARIEAAYNDAAGYGAKLRGNIWVRMNRELGTDIAPEDIDDVCYYNDVAQRIENFAGFRREIVVPALGQQFRIARGQRVAVFWSHKFRTQELAERAARFGLQLIREYTDGDFADLLLRRIASPKP